MWAIVDLTAGAAEAYASNAPFMPSNFLHDDVKQLDDVPQWTDGLHFPQIAVTANNVPNLVLFHIDTSLFPAGEIFDKFESFDNATGVALDASKVVDLPAPEFLEGLELWQRQRSDGSGNPTRDG